VKPEEPTHGGSTAAEYFTDYLDFFRSSVVESVTALPEAEHRTTRLPSGWTPIELLSHLLHMEERWFVWGFLGEQVEQPWGDWQDGEPGTHWSVDDHTTLPDLVDRLQAVGERTRAILRETALSTRGQVGERFEGDPPDLQWICFHVLQEYARHAGHLDIAAELATPTEESR
jgi:hypothetical protein